MISIEKLREELSFIYSEEGRYIYFCENCSTMFIANELDSKVSYPICPHNCSNHNLIYLGMKVDEAIEKFEEYIKDEKIQINNVDENGIHIEILNK